MGKRKLQYIFGMMTLSLAVLTACSNKEVSDQSNTSDATQSIKLVPTQEANATTPTATPVLSEEEQIRKDMINRSLLTVGNNYRMKKVMEKAKRGEDVTIAYIGGSITEGYNAGTKENFAKLTYEYFADTYGSRDTVHMVNAGLSGTPSTLGLIRSERDVFAYKPDILFIEFAVNDGQSGNDPVAYESLIAKALKQDNEPAVVLLYSVIKSGYTCQNQMALTGFQYKLPGISVTNALQPEFDAGRLTWEEWSNDESHPNEFGHKLYSEFIINYFKTVEAAPVDEPVKMSDHYKAIRDYTGMQFVDNTKAEALGLGSFQTGSTHAKFQNGWVKSQGTGDNKAIRFKMTASSIFIVYKEVNNDSLGTADVYVDGEKVTNLAGSTANGWGNPQNALLYYSKESAEHTVEIKMAAGEEEKAFEILGFGVCP